MTNTGNSARIKITLTSSPPNTKSPRATGGNLYKSMKNGKIDKLIEAIYSLDPFGYNDNLGFMIDGAHHSVLIDYGMGINLKKGGLYSYRPNDETRFPTKDEFVTFIRENKNRIQYY